MMQEHGFDNLRDFSAADLRFCFSHMQKAGFLMMQLVSK